MDKLDKTLPALALLTLLAVALGFWGESLWPLTLLVNLLPYFTAAALPLTVLLLVRQRLLAAVLASVAAGASALAVAATLIPSGQEPEGALKDDLWIKGRATLRVLVANVHYRNPDMAAFASLVRHERPDLVAVVESSPHWRGVFDRLAGEYPHQAHLTRSDPWGMSLLSRVPLDSVRLEPLPGTPFSAAFARLRIGGRELQLVVAHPPPPTNEAWFRQRDEYLEWLRLNLDPSLPRLVVGDLNLSTWSRRFRHWLERTGLVSGRRGQGLLATWPAWLGRFGIPLDHVLGGGGLSVRRLDTVEISGSDHHGLLATLAWKEPGP